jgi:hypothetical protein
VPAHKFKIGQTVILESNLLNRGAARGAYKVTRRLPESNGQFEYQIKHSSEPHERIAKENELSAA